MVPDTIVVPKEDPSVVDSNTGTELVPVHTWRSNNGDWDDLSKTDPVAEVSLKGSSEFEEDFGTADFHLMQE